MENVFLRKRNNTEVLVLLLSCIIVLAGCNSSQSVLDDNDIYSIMSDAIINVKTEVFFDNEIELSKVTDAYVLIYQYEPMAIGITTELGVKRDRDDDEQISSVKFNYLLPAEEIKKQKTEIEKVITPVLEDLCNQESESDKVNTIIDFLCDDFSYDDTSEDADSVFSALCRKQGSCQGLAKSFVLLCNRAGMKCGYCVGLLNDYPHMWNYIIIDGEEKNIDVLNDSINNSENSGIFKLLENKVEYPLHMNN